MIEKSQDSVLFWIARAQKAQARALGYRDPETRYYPEPINEAQGEENASEDCASTTGSNQDAREGPSV